MTARFRVDLPLAGQPPHVELNDRELAGVEAVSVTTDPGGVTRLYLTFAGEGTIDGEGIVHVVRDLDQRQVVAEFLGSLDVDTLEKDVLKESGGYGDARGPGATVLDVLRRYVRSAGE